MPLLPEEREFRIDGNTRQYLEELCEDMTNTCGLVTAMLELALSKSQSEQLRCIEGAKLLSLRGMETLKRFLWRWAELRESPAVEEIPASAEHQQMIRLAREAVSAYKIVWMADAKGVDLKHLRDSYIEETLVQCEGRVGKAAKKLGIGRTTLYRILQGRKSPAAAETAQSS